MNISILLIMHIRHFQAALLPILFLFFSCSNNERFSDEEKETIEEQTKSLVTTTIHDSDLNTPFFEKYHLGADLAKDFKGFYQERNYVLAWLDLEGVFPQAESLLEAVKQAHHHGLDSNSYPIQEIRFLRKALFEDSIGADSFPTLSVQLDFALTATFISYGTHMLSGVISPENNDLLWVTYHRQMDWAVYLEETLVNGDVVDAIEALVPTYSQYNLLKEKLALYRELKADSSKNYNAPISLGTGDDSLKIIVPLKERLNLLGDLPESALKQSPDGWDERITNAIASFQERHGMANDGILDAETLAALNVSIEVRIEQIILNMERLRWLPESLGEKYLLINIPDYQLRIMKKGKVDLMMKVIVGKVMTKTPVFSDTMEYIVFSPTWTVPKSISIEEMLPKIKEDENYFDRNNFVLYEDWSPDAQEIDPHDVKWKKIDEENFGFKIVERPGRGNALGSVKFIFPNSHAIYLHDTPAGHLFNQTERGFSYGCIRVEKPQILSEYLLKENNQGWDLDKIASHMALDTPTTVTLKQQLPIHIVYHSAWVDKDNRIHFLKDIYQQDRIQKKAFEIKERQLKETL